MLSGVALFAFLFLPQLVLPGALPGQTAPGHLVSWAGNSGPLTVCSALYTFDVENNCQPPVSRGSSLCTPLGPGAGGTAYDPRSQAAWVSDGREIGLQSIGTGVMLCKFASTRVANTTVVSGLAMSDSRRELFQLETGPGIMAISSYDVRNPCQPVHNANACQVPILGTLATAQSLAYDEVRDLLYHTVSISGFAGWGSTCYVTARGAPCTSLNSFPVNYCGSRPGSPISGLGYDACTKKLYVTEGAGIRILLLTDPAAGNVTDLTGTGPCCTAGSIIGAFAGLAVIPDWSQSSPGTSCLPANCGSCPSMRAELIGGDAGLGNQDFGLRLSGAPVGQQALLYISAGACTSGINLPGFCAPVFPSLTPPFPFLAGAFQISGTAPCTGTVSLVTGVPVDPALCDFSLCAQWLVACRTAGGPGVSNAVQFTIGS